MEKLINKKCITIKQLKDFVKDLPEKNEIGDDYEVWIGDDMGFSNPCTQIWPLNKGDIELS